MVGTLHLAELSSGLVGLTHGICDTCLDIRTKEDLMLSNSPPPPRPASQDHPQHSTMDAKAPGLNKDPGLDEAVYKRFMENITNLVSVPQVVRD